MPTINDPPSLLPCAVQLGFAGSRRFYDLPQDDRRAPMSLYPQVQDYLGKRLGELPAELGLTQKNHFLCAISQVAAGADTLFTQACQSLNLPQRIFLPQPRDAFLEAVGADGVADFSPAERATALALLASPHVIQEQVVSDSPDRRARFEDANREILRGSDVIVCLLRADAIGQPGGTADMLELARMRGTPVLEIRVAVRDGQPCFEERWHGREGFQPPALPAAVARVPFPSSGTGLPDVARYCGAVQEHVSAQAQRHSEAFFRAAMVVIATHITATLLATLALAGHRIPFLQPAVAWLLGFELVVLWLGFLRHRWLHHRHPSRIWAISRLLAEIHRSVRSLGNLRFDLGYLLRLNLPADLGPLLQTLNILHQRSTHQSAGEAWQTIRAQYLQSRLADPSPKKGQIAYYRHHSGIAQRRLRAANRMFLCFSLAAIVATAVKLAVVLDELHVPEQWEGLAAGTLGTLAIILPVLAVGILSWAAAKDYEARFQTYRQMHAFLNAQQGRFPQATSAREFEQLVEETETRLLGETADWYSRRSFAGVA